jgi:3-deoxy-manno-octulosonate cytidylyltransferase (CMP-KDO synthetase)
VIPARYKSRRLPGKPLKQIGDKPMIQWVYEQARLSKVLDRILVATDDQRVFESVMRFDGEAVMTRDCASGTDRVAEAVRQIEADIIVNIQGDEPFIQPKAIDLVAGILIHDPDAHMGTLIKRIFHADELASRDTVKVIINRKGYAVYFSRSPIPFCRDHDLSDWVESALYYKHIGLYSYRKPFLQKISQMPVSPLENAEKLEQLRVIDYGYLIKVAETDSETIGVDTPEDLIHANQMVARGAIK